MMDGEEKSDFFFFVTYDSFIFSVVLEKQNFMTYSIIIIWQKKMKSMTKTEFIDVLILQRGCLIFHLFSTYE